MREEQALVFWICFQPFLPPFCLFSSLEIFCVVSTPPNIDSENGGKTNCIMQVNAVSEIKPMES